MPMQMESERLKQKETKKVKLSLPYWLLGSKNNFVGRIVEYGAHN